MLAGVAGATWLNVAGASRRGWCYAAGRRLYSFKRFECLFGNCSIRYAAESRVGEIPEEVLELINYLVAMKMINLSILQPAIFFQAIIL